MTAKEAVEVAKKYIQDLFGSERIYNVGLEEVEFDPSGEWVVTIGFSRPWDTPSGSLAEIAQQIASPRRSYKVVHIMVSTGAVRAVKNREAQS